VRHEKLHPDFVEGIKPMVVVCGDANAAPLYIFFVLNIIVDHRRAARARDHDDVLTL
jgi:hypothetical protein